MKKVVTLIHLAEPGANHQLVVVDELAVVVVLLHRAVEAGEGVTLEGIEGQAVYLTRLGVQYVSSVWAATAEITDPAIIRPGQRGPHRN